MRCCGVAARGGIVARVGVARVGATKSHGDATSKSPRQPSGNDRSSWLSDRRQTICVDRAITGLNLEKQPNDPRIGKKLAVFAMTLGYRIDEAFMRDVKDNVLEQVETFAKVPEISGGVCAYAHVMHELVVKTYEVQEKRLGSIPDAPPGW
jgi:hypothetical protein